MRDLPNPCIAGVLIPCKSTVGYPGSNVALQHPVLIDEVRSLLCTASQPSTNARFPHARSTFNFHGADHSIDSTERRLTQL